MAEAKVNLMQRHSLKNLSNRVNAAVGIEPLQEGSAPVYAQNVDGNTTWLATSNGDYRESEVTDPDYDASPSRRALHAF